MYILKQLFFSISVNSGFRNIYLAASRLGIIICGQYSPRFQRIIVNYHTLYFTDLTGNERTHKSEYLIDVASPPSQHDF